MFSRLSQVTRHLSHSSLAQAARAAAPGMMVATAVDERRTRTIHTAACLIIGDEVLGGKVRRHSRNHMLGSLIIMYSICADMGQ